MSTCSTFYTSCTSTRCHDPCPIPTCFLVFAILCDGNSHFCVFGMISSLSFWFPTQACKCAAYSIAQQTTILPCFTSRAESPPLLPHPNWLLLWLGRPPIHFFPPGKVRTWTVRPHNFPSNLPERLKMFSTDQPSARKWGSTSLSALALSYASSSAF